MNINIDKNLIKKSEDTKVNTIDVKTTINKKEESVKNVNSKNLEEFNDLLECIGIKNSKINKLKNGLYELKMSTKNNNNISLTLDLDGVVYDSKPKFWLGKLLENDDVSLTNKCYYIDFYSIRDAYKEQNLLDSYGVNQKLIGLNKYVDTASLKESDKYRRLDVYDILFKIFNDSEVFNGLKKNFNGENFRFIFSEYESCDKFVLECSPESYATNIDKSKKINTMITSHIKYDNLKVDITVDNVIVKDASDLIIKAV